jgi:nitrate reductase assembly molybdenum cofactor insertion protein NarJ
MNGISLAPFLAEAAEWRLLGLLFERPRRQWRDELAALSAEVRDLNLAHIAHQALSAGEGRYLALVGPGGAVSPRAVAYRDSNPGRLLAEIRSFYDAFAYQPRTEETSDHVAVMVGFAAYLALKVAYAEAEGRSEELEITTRALERFREEHLKPVAGALAWRLREKDESWLALAAGFLAQRLGAPIEDIAPPRKTDDCHACAAAT